MNYDAKVVVAGCEPTPAMLRAGCAALAPHNELSGCEAGAVWEAMLAACPPALGDAPVSAEHVARAARAYCAYLKIEGPSDWHMSGITAALLAISGSEYRTAAQPRKVVCHRLHTPGGRWGWVDGEPSLQCLDDARNFGWKLELAYVDEPPTDDRWELTEAGRAMRGGK